MLVHKVVVRDMGGRDVRHFLSSRKYETRKKLLALQGLKI